MLLILHNGQAKARTPQMIDNPIVAVAVCRVPDKSPKNRTNVSSTIQRAEANIMVFGSGWHCQSLIARI